MTPRADGTLRGIKSNVTLKAGDRPGNLTSPHPDSGLEAGLQAAAARSKLTGDARAGGWWVTDDVRGWLAAVGRHFAAVAACRAVLGAATGSLSAQGDGNAQGWAKFSGARRSQHGSEANRCVAVPRIGTPVRPCDGSACDHFDGGVLIILRLLLRRSGFP